MRYVNSSLVFHPVISLSLEGTVVTQSNPFGIICKHFFSSLLRGKRGQKKYFKINVCSGNFPIEVSLGERDHLKHSPPHLPWQAWDRLSQPWCIRPRVLMLLCRDAEDGDFFKACVSVWWVGGGRQRCTDPGGKWCQSFAIGTLSLHLSQGPTLVVMLPAHTLVLVHFLGLVL